MGSRVKDFQNGFAGGANPMAGSGIAPLDCVASMTNMRVVRNQELAKRPGLRTVGVSGTVITGQLLYPARFSGDGATANLLLLDSAAHVNFNLFSQFSGAPFINQIGTGTLAASYLTGRGSATFRDGTAEAFYIGAPVNAKGLIKWPAGSLSVVEGIGTASVSGIGQLWVYNQRLFGAKGGYQSTAIARTATLYYSGLNNGDTIGDTANGGGSAAIRAFGEASNIVGGFALGGSNYILHQSAISVFRGTTFDDINITAGAEGVSPNIGFPMGWAVIDQVAYIATSEGFFLLTENGGVRAAGTATYPDPLARYIRQLPTTIASNIATFGPWFILDNPRRNEVWIIANFSISAGGTVSKLFIWNTELQRFTGEGTFGCTIDFAATVLDAFQSTQQMLFVSGANVYGCDFLYDSAQVYADGGTMFASSVTLRRMYTVDDPASVKSWRQATVQMGAGAGETPLTANATTGAIAKYVTNNGGTVTASATLVAQDSCLVQLSGQGPFIDMTITDNGTISVGWSLMRAEVEGHPYTRRNG